MAFLNGIHVPHRKNTAGKAVSRFVPETVTVPMSVNIGAPAKPVVKVGDLVKVGTLIGEAGGFVSAPVHASVSGKVSKIVDLLTSNGGTAPAVVIESDGEMAMDESVAPPVVDSRESLLAAIKDSGVVGLGGAGFPTHVKFAVEEGRIQTLVINGAECEPYITSDTVTMTTRAADMAVAVKALHKYFGINEVVIGVESHNKAAVSAMMDFMKENAGDGLRITVKVLPSVYPQGGEKVLVYHTTGKVIPTGKLPIDVGVVVCNCTTVAAIGAYLQSGMPLVEKCVTVDGGAIKEPQNVIVPVGTKISDLFAFCGGFTEEPAEVLYGGPMMGVGVPDAELPVMKSTNAVLALTEKESRLPKTTACIRCGSCTNTCPFGLAPASIAAAFKKKDAEKLEALSVNTCMECGCCSFVCPANRPLVQTNKLAKAFLREEKAKEEAKA